MSNFKSPSIRVGVNKGKTYYWCGCGLSKKQPFCDGSHKEDEQGRKPITYTALADKRGGPSWSDSYAAMQRINSIVKIKLQTCYSLALSH